MPSPVTDHRPSAKSDNYADKVAKSELTFSAPIFAKMPETPRGRALPNSWTVKRMHLQ